MPMLGKLVEKLPCGQCFVWAEPSRTCALWTCGSGFASNEAYSTNVSWQSLWGPTQNHPNPKHSKTKQESRDAKSVRSPFLGIFSLRAWELQTAKWTEWHQLMRYFKAMRCAATRLVPWSSAKQALRTKVRKPSH